jgi:UDP-N-acetylmuramyl pentapeptide phosphotransferase/UDP-N-acetylglucosamine-1-phosphate transferase
VIVGEAVMTAFSGGSGMVVAFSVSLVWREIICSYPPAMSRQNDSSHKPVRPRPALHSPLTLSFCTLTFIDLVDFITKKRNRLLGPSIKAVLLIKIWMGHSEAERWVMELADS